MEDHPEFELAVVESLEGQPLSEDREGLAGAALSTRSTEAIETVEALKATKGAPAVLERFPQLAHPALWRGVAYFSLPESRGTAQALKISGEPGVRVTVDGELMFGVDPYPQQPMGGYGIAAECLFRAPSPGLYTCSVRLVSWADSLVKCSIDDKDFGDLPVYGTLTQPHVASLGVGSHRFRVEQQNESYAPFVFDSVKVWMVPEVAGFGS